MKRTLSILISVLALACCTGVLVAGGTTSTGHNDSTLAPIYYPSTSISILFLADCSVSKLIIVSPSANWISKLPYDAPLGTVCQFVVSDGNYNVTVASQTGDLIATPLGGDDAYATCTNDGGNDSYGCRINFLRLTSSLWTSLGTPHGNWVWGS